MRINIYICKLAIGPKLNGQAWQERQNGAKQLADISSCGKNKNSPPFNQEAADVFAKTDDHFKGTRYMRHILGKFNSKDKAELPQWH